MTGAGVFVELGYLQGLKLIEGAILVVMHALGVLCYCLPNKISRIQRPMGAMEPVELPLTVILGL